MNQYDLCKPVLSLADDFCLCIRLKFLHSACTKSLKTLLIRVVSWRYNNGVYDKMFLVCISKLTWPLLFIDWGLLYSTFFLCLIQLGNHDNDRCQSCCDLHGTDGSGGWRTKSSLGGGGCALCGVMWFWVFLYSGEQCGLVFGARLRRVECMHRQPCRACC